MLCHNDDDFGIWSPLNYLPQGFYTSPQKRSDREQVSNKVAGVWIETEMDLQVLPRLHICIWYHRLDELWKRTLLCVLWWFDYSLLRAYIPGPVAIFNVRVSELILFGRDCPWICFENLITWWQNLEEDWNVKHRKKRFTVVTAILRPGGFCGSQQCWQVFFGHWPGFGSKTSC